MPIEVAARDAVATVTINRPDALNAFNESQMRDLLAVFRGFRTDRTVRAVVVTGAGDRAFAAGADIKAMAGMSQRAALEFARLGHAVASAIETTPQPVIAAVNGFALGGGCELALACDIRLASENAQFAQPEVQLGVPPGWGGTQRLPRLVGPGRAAELIYTGRRIDAAEALRIGLVNAVYPPENLLEEAVGLASRIALNSPSAVTAAKRAMALALDGDVAKGLAVEARFFAECFEHADQREGMAAFVDKRRPEFTGA